MPSFHSRLQQFPDFYTERGLFICLYCCHSVDFEKVSTIKNHINSSKHKLRKKTKLRRPAIPVNISTSISASQKRSEFVKDYVAMFLKSNIPLEKSNSMTEFMRKHCSEGGAITDSNNLRRVYVPLVAEGLRKSIIFNITAAFENHQIFALSIDETTDDRERHVLNVILKFADTTNNNILFDTIFLNSAVTAQVLGQTANAIIQIFNLGDQRMFFLTDNTSYCYKAYRECLLPLYPKMHWIGCWPHIVDLCCNTWQPTFKYSRVLGLLKNFFRKKVSAGRKQRWIIHQKLNAVQKPKLPPTPCFKRWTTWIKACMYHAEVIDLYSSFLENESSITESGTLKELKYIFNDVEEFIKLKVQLVFISEHGKQMMDTVEFFELRNNPIAHQVYNTIFRFRQELDNGKTSVAFRHKRDALLNTFSNAGIAQSIALSSPAFKRPKKLETPLKKQEEIIQLFKAFRIFDPRQKPSMSKSLKNHSVLPDFDILNDAL